MTLKITLKCIIKSSIEVPDFGIGPGVLGTYELTIRGVNHVNDWSVHKAIHEASQELIDDLIYVDVADIRFDDSPGFIELHHISQGIPDGQNRPLCPKCKELLEDIGEGDHICRECCVMTRKPPF